jgi:hypothetical protein
VKSLPRLPLRLSRMKGRNGNHITIFEKTLPKLAARFGSTIRADAKSWARAHLCHF